MKDFLPITFIFLMFMLSAAFLENNFFAFGFILSLYTIYVLTVLDRNKSLSSFMKEIF